MTISIGSDHRGHALKNEIKFHFLTHAKSLFGQDFKLEFHDVGTHDDVRSDYPVFAKKACDQVLEGKADFAILICGSGVGMAIAANRYKKIYAALCWKPEIAEVARKDDGINVLALSADYVSKEENFKIVETMIKQWSGKKELEERYQNRLNMLDGF